MLVTNHIVRGQQLVLREHVADEAQGQVPPFTASSSTTSSSTTQYRRVLRVWAPSQSGLALLGPSVLVAHWPDCAFSGISSIDEVHQRAFEVVRGSSVGRVANLETSLVPPAIVPAGTDVGQQQIAPV